MKILSVTCIRKRNRRYTETKARKKSLVQDGDTGEQSQPGV